MTQAKIAMFLVLCIVLIQCSLSPGQRAREISVTQTLGLASWTSAIDHATLFSLSYFCLDDKENLYVDDMSNHRILRCDKNGKPLGMIGGIGQGPQDLLTPMGCFIEGEMLYVLNDAGKEIKLFTLEGRALSQFRIKDAWLADSLAVGRGLVFVGVRYQGDDYNARGLITVLSEGGGKKTEIGRLTPSNSLTGYLNFNRIALAAAGETVYGALIHKPVAFAYQTDGKEVFYVSLEKLGLVQIEERLKRDREGSKDTPETTKEDLSFNGIIYCEGFGVGKKGHFFYAVNDYRPSPRNEREHLILHFNDRARLVEKLAIKYRGAPVMTRGIYIAPWGARYGMGQIDNGPYFLFKF